MKNWTAELALLTGLLGVTGGALANAGSIESDPIDSHAMLIPDMPALPPQRPTIILVAQTNQAQDSTKRSERVLGVCEVIDNEEHKGANGEIYPNSDDIYALSSALSYFQKYEHRNDFTSEDLKGAKTTILQQPKNGALIEVVTDPDISGDYRYTPNAGYVGSDSAEILVEIKGIKVKVRFFIHVTEYREPNPYDNNCNEAPTNPWKISVDGNGN